MLSLCSGAPELQLHSPTTEAHALRARILQEKSPQWGARTQPLESNPQITEKPAQPQRPSTAKINKLIFKKALRGEDLGL